MDLFHIILPLDMVQATTLEQNPAFVMFVTGLSAFLLAALLALTCTPIARALAMRWGAIDIPRGRHIHKAPTPLMGGLAMYLAFCVTLLLFFPIDRNHLALIGGATVVVVTGIFDDIFELKPLIKLIAQIAAACVVVFVSTNVVINHIFLFNQYIEFGFWAYPLTILWIVALINAMNWIDGLDGLACGVSAISSLALLVITVMMADSTSAVITAILAGSCIGFLPYNFNPAKIFMGDTGAMFLGYILAVISAQGVFKTHAIISFVIPFLIFGFPLLDAAISIIRRLLAHKAPWAADKNHLHHKLIDMGLNTRQSVGILYAISGILAISAVILARQQIIPAIIIIVAALVIGFVNYMLLRNEDTRRDMGFENPPPEEAEKKEEKKRHAVYRYFINDKKK